MRHYFGEMQPRQRLCTLKEVELNGRLCWVPEDADGYLREIYGDYMQIPPVEKQERNCYLAYDLGQYDGC